MEKRKRWAIVVRGLLLTISLLGCGVAGFTEFYFAVEPRDTVVAKDGSALLNCSVVGSPKPSVTWKKEATLLNFAGDTRRSVLENGSLLLDSIYHLRSDRSDEGPYQCKATIENVGSIVSRTAILQVASLLRFQEEPKDAKVFPGQTAYFSCSIQAVPPANIQWLKDDHPVELDPSRMTVLPSGALEVDHIQATDAGKYSCNASNIEGFRVSSYSTLTVSLNYAEANKVSAPSFVSTPKNAIANEGSTVTLDCAANGNPRPKVTWLKDGITIDMMDLDSRFSSVGVGSLQIEPATESDEGVYMCRAENHEDSVDVSASLQIQVPPRFTKKPESKFVYEKEDVELECEIYGKPDPVKHWLKNGDRVGDTESDYFQIVSGFNLRILGLVAADRGFYQCVGSNPAGSIQAAAQLVILDPESPVPTTRNFQPTPGVAAGTQARSKDVPSPPREAAAVIVSTRFATLSWQEPVRTNGDIFAYSVYYREDGSNRERVINTTRLRLEEVSVQGLRPATKYFFRVVAYNQHGPGQSSPEIMVETQPEVHVPGSPQNLRVMSDSPTSLVVRWEAPDAQPQGIQRYKLYYMEVGTAEEHEVTTSELTYTLKDLRKFTEYSVWVVAYNQNGPGLSTEEATTRTLSDVPSDTPQNVTVEAASSTSIIVRWEPPPKESQNGIITGYKIRFKVKGSRRGDTFTTDGNRRLYALSSLERGAQYSIKISALSINGSGPSTEWLTAETYQNDLDESRVPDQPSSLRGRPTSTTIYVTWTPPQNQNIMIRGYTIGWGIGLPDVYTKVLDGKQRYYTIENLQASSEYVISLRAFNQVGDGQPIYETVKTLIETTPEPLTPMLPPVGLKAIVLSSSTVVLYWTDTTLPRNQLVTDNRFYTARWTGHSYSANPKYRYLNSTELNCMVDDLKPNTQYEFTVKVIKGRRESTWSMSAFNTTQEAAPSSPPRDLTVVPMEEEPTTINLQWQPPKQPNGQITGYLIFYTTDNTQRDRDWVVEGVVGDKMTTTLKGLTSDTTYFFKIQARNNKGYGPISHEVTFHTDAGIATGAALQDGSGLTNNMLYIIIACVSGVTLIVIVAVSTIVCRRRHGYLGPVRTKGYGSGKGGNKELKPPDLWIHHDHMELKAIEKGHNGDATAMTVTPIPRNSQDLGDDSASIMGTLEKKKASYIGDSLSDDTVGLMPRRPLRAKPIMIGALDAQNNPPREPIATAISNGALSQHMVDSGGRPVYPRTQYNIPRAHVTLDSTLPVSSPELPSPSVLSQQPPMYEQVAGQPPSPHAMGQHSSYTSVLLAGDGGSLGGKRPSGHPLKSFSVPAPPPQNVPATAIVPQAKHLAMRPQLASSPGHKKTPPPSNAGTMSSAVKSSRPPGAPLITAKAVERRLVKDDSTTSNSTEELNQEMANLEGLMKDLNAITASEFEC